MFPIKIRIRHSALFYDLPVTFLATADTTYDASLLELGCVLQHVRFGCLHGNSNLRNSDLRIAAHQVNYLSSGFSESLSYSFSYRLSYSFCLRLQTRHKSINLRLQVGVV